LKIRLLWQDQTCNLAAFKQPLFPASVQDQPVKETPVFGTAGMTARSYRTGEDTGGIFDQYADMSSNHATLVKKCGIQVTQF
jgi:hypothetical protein